MKTISIINLKGGVGKTYTAYNIAYELQKRGKTVLLLDNDKQGNLSKAAGAYIEDGECAAAKAILGEYTNPLKELIAEHPQHNNVDIITANMSLMTAIWTLSKTNKNQTDVYKKLIHTPITNLELPFPDTISDYYDYLIIDNPPDIGFNVIAALKITDEVIVPVKIDEWALEGLDIITEQIEYAKLLNPNIKLLGALVTMYKNNDTNIAGLEWLEQKSKVKILGHIRYTDKAAESTFFNKAAYEYSPRCGAAQDYKKLVEKYLNESEAVINGSGK